MRNNYTLAEIIKGIYSIDQIENAVGLACFANRTKSGNFSFQKLSSIIKLNVIGCFQKNMHYMIYHYPETNTEVFKITLAGKDFLSNSENRIRLLSEIASYMDEKVAGYAAEYGLQSYSEVVREINEAIRKEKHIFEQEIEL